MNTLDSLVQLLPHRYPILMIDRVLQIEDRQSIVAIKNISFSDPMLQGHFPDHPVVPGSAMVEAMTQASCLIFLRDPDYVGRMSVLDTIHHFQWYRPVYAGDQLRLEVSVEREDVGGILLEGKALVEGKLVAEGKWTLRLAQAPSKPQIHPTSSVHASAILGKDVVIGPHCSVGENVIIGDRTILEAHVMIEKWTRIGQDCHFHFGCVIGSDPQDVKYGGEKTWVVIGDRNILREYVTINRSTGKDTVTEIGSDNMFLTHVHIPHNCKIGHFVTIANMTNLGGHTHVEDCVLIGGMTGIHQFVRIGKGAMVGAYTRLPQDVAPYTLCEGNPALTRGLNLVGLKRRGISKAAIDEIKSIFKVFYRSDLNRSQALDKLVQETFQTPEALHMLDFLKEESPRGITKKSDTSTCSED